MKKITFGIKSILLTGFMGVLISFKRVSIPEETRLFIHQMLNKHFDESLSNQPLKQFEINITNTGFCRYRKVYKNGKQEFFAFNLSKFKSLDYYGGIKSGMLCIRTKNDDVIVQTRHDKAGNVDTMARHVLIPLKEIDAENLNQLSTKLSSLGNEKPE